MSAAAAYALVLIVVTQGMNPFTTTTVVYGFNTKESCKSAAEQIRKDTNYDYRLTASCIPVDYRP